jgi:hypothetical protein
MAQRNEGEGSRSAARDYNAARAKPERSRTRAFVRTGRARKSAKQAQAAMDTPEGTQMREAEIRGKAQARGEDPQLYKKGKPGQDPKPDPDLE